MRKLGQGSKTITATPRQLESLIRISEALAKMRLSSVVEKKDVQEAVRLIKEAQQSAATDPITGLIDLDLISLPPFLSYPLAICFLLLSSKPPPPQYRYWNLCCCSQDAC